MAIFASNLPAAKDDIIVQLIFKKKGKVLSFKPSQRKGNEALILMIPPNKINIEKDTEVDVKVVMKSTGVESEPKNTILYMTRNDYQPTANHAETDTFVKKSSLTNLVINHQPSLEDDPHRLCNEINLPNVLQ